ncbi:hypothetical protein IFM89_014295 [Coptis chinensis]|uniref:Uncharacterized protein n=1 Tax=Coptis chinensis TaxID=261450 RepID=A0A835LUA6_9MAGN|nr:hypothetical protein IFM89_014295 [Coptis chinensis]
MSSRGRGGVSRAGRTARLSDIGTNVPAGPAPTQPIPAANDNRPVWVDDMLGSFRQIAQRVTQLERGGQATQVNQNVQGELNKTYQGWNESLGKDVGEVHEVNPPRFGGISDPNKAEEWKEDLENIFDVMDYSEGQNLSTLREVVDIARKLEQDYQEHRRPKDYPKTESSDTGKRVYNKYDSQQQYIQKKQRIGSSSKPFFGRCHRCDRGICYRWMTECRESQKC